MQNVSIIVTCQEQRPQLERLLPLLLSQLYGGEYEVIVVDILHDKDIEEWLEEMEVHYPHLHHTFCPASARGIDIYRLAFTLGAKAANYEWLVFLSVDAVLPGNGWLSHLTTCCCDQADIVIGIADYESGGGWYGKKIRFKQRWKRFTWSVFPQHRVPYLVHPGLILYRRSYFLQTDQRIKKSRCRVNRLPEAAIKLPLPPKFY